MEQAGTIPRGLVDVSAWRDLLLRPGPVATACLAVPGATDNAGPKNLLRWQEARRQLEGQGAAPGAVDPIDDVIADAHRFGEGVAVYADAGGMINVTYSPVPPRSEVVGWDTLASLSPVLGWRQHQPAYVVVLVDHRGADLFASGSGISDHHEEAGAADRYPLARNAPGGWSQRRYQQHAVENWAGSAREVADAVGRLSGEVHPEIVLVGGDPRSVELLMGALPGPVAGLTTTVEASRAADGGGDRSAREVARMVETVAARRTVEVLEEFRMHRGRGDRAVEGVGPTLQALRENRVTALLFHDGPTDGRRAWFGSDPTAVAATAEMLEGVGGGPIGDGRLVDVAVRAAATSGAAVRLVPEAGGPAEGLGALLRWSD